MYGFKKSIDKEIVSFILPEDFYDSRNECLDSLIVKNALQGKEINKSRLNELMNEYDAICPKAPIDMGPHLVESPEDRLKAIVKTLNEEKKK